jgi:hypothetical protein
VFRVLGPGVVGLLALVLWLYAIIDVIRTDDVLVRNLPKMLWLLIVLFIPTLGSLLWLLLGRPLYAGWVPGAGYGRAAPRYSGPEDAPDYRPSTSASLPPAPSGSPDASDAARLRAWEDDLARRERELRERRPEGPDAGR